MNPYLVLNIEPTDDKMAIRRAYVRETKRHHPDHGGDAGHFRLIQKAYDGLINNEFEIEVIDTDVAIPLINLMEGCIATVAINNGTYQGTLFEISIPDFTYPGSTVEFSDKALTYRKIRVKLMETKTNEYTRIDSTIIVQKQINTTEAKNGVTLDIRNFNDKSYTINIPPDTTATRLIYNIPGAGFYERDSRVRGNLSIIVEVQHKGI